MANIVTATKDMSVLTDAIEMIPSLLKARAVGRAVPRVTAGIKVRGRRQDNLHNVMTTYDPATDNVA